MAEHMHNFSIIIPCYQDESILPGLLAQLRTMPDKVREIIIVDGAGRESCRRICQSYRAHWLPSLPCRGQQLLTGAAKARGDVLWFLHADARLSPDSCAAIARAIKNGAIGGFFKFRFDAPREWPAVVLEPVIALRCRMGVPYGDQGLFILREHYQKTGGHAPWPLFEEVTLVQGARRAGKFAALREPIFVNPGRWRRDGWWRRTWRNRKLALKFLLGVAPEVLAAHYYADKTSAKR